ncbi:MAG: thioredoxin domain-containing protein [Bacillota bacterium]
MNANGKPNRLIQGKSPYLIEHAYNPVEWFPWSNEAFEKARLEDKPIFLSIGYSTCHWCHVMAKESFEDEQVARILNNGFVCIKVDREQRPDIDAVYMAACQAFTGQGGWPLTILMTADAKPFYAGTYFPKNGTFGAVGLIELLESTLEQWKNNRDKLERAGEIVIRQTREYQERTKDTDPVDAKLASEPARQLNRSYDKIYGGFGRAPKFPSPHQILYLMDYAAREKDERAKEIALLTLRSMYRGGLFDHIGGGFARYSTDAMFLIPHFEKMLYDNALLAVAYARAHILTNDPLYRIVAERTLGYLMHEMRDENGAFYSAQDADSEGEEGKFYALRPEEVVSVLGRSDAEWFNQWYGITKEGNFNGKSIPNLLGNEAYEREARTLPELREKVVAFRAKRMSLHTDKKILTGWNALAVVALCHAYRAFGGERYLEAAKRTIDAIHTLLAGDGALHANYFDGAAFGSASLDDHASLAWAYLELYRSAGDWIWLEMARRMLELIERDFNDAQKGGYFLTGAQAEKLIFRPKELFDGAVPSGNSIVAYLQCALFELTGETLWRTRADAQLQFLASAIRQHPPGHCFAAMALMMRTHPNRELVLQLPDERTKRELLSKLFAYIGDDLWVLVLTPQSRSALATIAPMIGQYPENDNFSRYFLCEDHVCQAPISSETALIKALKE